MGFIANQNWLLEGVVGARAVILRLIESVDNLFVALLFRITDGLVFLLLRVSKNLLLNMIPGRCLMKTV